jgi:adenine-specific DNA-methyltransferase
MAKAPRKPIDVATVQHKGARRPNNPTMEMQSLLADDEASPTAVTFQRRYSPATHPELYQRNKALDPQLVWADTEDGEGAVQLTWRGKDEQDETALRVDAVPIYTAEKIHPKAIIDDIRRRAASDTAVSLDDQPDLFADFNGIDEDDRLEFYQHTMKWTNRMILGDSLQVMASLAEKEDLRGKVQCIYFDPPYGIKFNSNWQVSTRSRDVKDGKHTDLSREPEQVRAFRDTWADGIHSYLSYIRDRLIAARDLLTETGTVFVQIGDENVHRVRAVMDEVFGAENCLAQISVKKTSGATSEFLPGTVDFIIVYANNKDVCKFRSLYNPRSIAEDGDATYTFLRSEELDRSRLTASAIGQLPQTHALRVYRQQTMTSQSLGRAKGEGAASWFPVEIDGSTVRPPASARWKTNETGMDRLKKAWRLETNGKSISYVRFHGDFPVFPISDLWTDTQSGSAMDKTYVVQTSTKIVERCVLMATDPGDLVLDPTCGSGTTAYVAEQWGRRWIAVDTSRVALTLARTRLMSARFPYYALRDSEAGAVEEHALQLGRRPTEAEAAEVRAKGPFTNDIAHGLVLHRVPHVTLKSIVSNAEIDVLYEQHQAVLEPLREQLNTAAKTEWREWEIPRAPIFPWEAKPAKLHAKARALLDERDKLRSNWDRGEEGIDETDLAKLDKKIGKAIGALNKELGRSFTIDDFPEHPGDPLPFEALAPHAAWWEARIARQKAIDTSIETNAETEYLVDKPVELKGLVRVAGPFTVDSLSPHRVLPADEDDPLLIAALGDGEEAPHRLGTRADAGSTSDDFVRVVLDNLKVAGVGNTKKGERLRFTTIRPFAGRYVNAEGRYVEGESEGAPERRAAIFIGPEYDTVTRSMIVAAAREAADLFDVLVVCGFAFEAHASAETMSLGRLTVLKVNMNQDLRMGDRLKTADQGNLFVVFGEPDVNLCRRKDGMLEVEILGLDIFNPNTGELKPSGKVEDDVACWFIDDDYDQTSFFVRQAYFLGGKDPYEKLKSALKADLDEDAWSVLNSTVSQPFEAPPGGRIAVKVINHYGDEVMKVYNVAEAEECR